MSARTFWILVVVLVGIAGVMFYIFYRSSSSNNVAMGPSGSPAGPSGYGDLTPSQQFSPGARIYSSVARNVYRGTSGGWILYDDHPANELMGFFMGFKDVRTMDSAPYPYQGALAGTGIDPSPLNTTRPYTLIVMNTRPGGGGDEISTIYTPDIYTQ